MSGTTNGAWVEYEGDEIPTDATGVLMIVRVFGSEISALRSAVDAGNKVLRVQYGETLEEAIKRNDSVTSASGIVSTKIRPFKATYAGKPAPEGTKS